MNATIPVRSPVPEPLSLDEAADEGFEDDLVPLSSPAMQQALKSYAALVRERASDGELLALSKVQRMHERNGL